MLNFNSTHIIVALTGYSDKPNPKNYAVNELYNFENWADQTVSFIGKHRLNPLTFFIFRFFIFLSFYLSILTYIVLLRPGFPKILLLSIFYVLLNICISVHIDAKHKNNYYEYNQQLVELLDLTMNLSD